MNAPLLRTAGAVTPSGFSSSALRRACISHRAARLATCAAISAYNCPKFSGRQYTTSVHHEDSPQDTQPRLEPLSPIHSQNLPIVNPSVKSYEPVPELDPYLPLELRSKSWEENLTGFEGVRNPDTLSEVILQVNEKYSARGASRRFQSGVLTHIAVEQHRWPAYMYLAETLIKSKKRSPDLPGFLQNSPWATVDTTFPGLNHFESHIVFDPDSFQSPVDKVVTRSSIEDMVESQGLSGSASEQAIGALWRSLGAIVLASMRESDEYAAHMMMHVHCVLAMMHHENRMHPSIYDFDSETGFDVTRKPAFLHIMSSRFMGIVADAMWKVEARKTFSWYNLMVAADKKATGPKLLDSDPPVPFIEPQAWLELILWSCVHGSHVDAAMGIIEEMTSEGVRGDSWSTIPWQLLLKSALDNSESMESELQKFQQRFDRVSGDSGTDEDPLMDLPPRTISREVVSAAVQLSTSIPVHGGAQNLIEFIPDLLQNLLPPTRDFSTEQYWVSIVSRLLSLADDTTENLPTLLDGIGKLMKAINNVAASQDLGITGEDAGPQLDSGTPVISIHHRAMAAFLSLGNIDGALHAYIRLEKWLRRQVDGLERGSEQVEKAITEENTPTNRRAPAPTAEEVTLHEKRKKELQESIETLRPMLPNGTLTTLVNLIIKHKRPELAKRVLAAAGTDDLIPREYFQSETLQPVLIRLGIALKDYQIIQEVARHVDSREVGRRPELLHSLLFAQVAFRKFKPARAILGLMRNLGLETSDESVMVIARAILELENAGDGALTQGQLTQACDLLRDILTQRYSPRPEQLAAPHYSRRRRLNQLSRVLASTSGYLYDASAKGIIRAGHASGSGTIAPGDFNILLKAVVKYQGPITGKSLYQKWCISPQPLYISAEESDASPDPYLPFQDEELEDDKPCVPAAAINIQTVIEPVIEHMRNSMPSFNKTVQRTDVESVAMKVLGVGPRPLTHSTATANQSECDGNGVAGTAQVSGHGHRHGTNRRAGLVIRKNIPLRPLDYSLLEWAKNTLLDLKWTAENIVREYPEVFDITEAENWRARAAWETDLNEQTMDASGPSLGSGVPGDTLDSVSDDA